ncbi:(2Fe-2S)-binding protein [Streptomyces sp. NRRL F-5126]|uniref:(2Fe-2S)-binding protein n=1 Tax=Streptomyces sp. NRRL F-5126 TaxID=1463857 RepID=UPI0004C6935E|nr:(2Fe-2S)-binding protein [Streptomyces sp. NRRL F-5126]
MYVCSCFGITEAQVKEHAEAGACSPRQIASQCGAGTDCGGCVRRIQSILGRGTCPRRELLEGRTAPAPATPVQEPGAAPAPAAPAPASPARLPIAPAALPVALPAAVPGPLRLPNAA